MNTSSDNLLSRLRHGRGGIADLVCRVLVVSALMLPTSAVQSRTSLADLIAEAQEAHQQALLEEKLEKELEDQVDDAIDEEIEDQVEDQVADAIDDQVEDVIDEVIEDEIQESIADALEEQVEERIADTVEESVEEMIADTVEESIEEGIAATVEESIEEGIASTIEDSVEEGIADATEESVQQSIEDNILDSVIDSIIDDTEQQLEARVDTPERHLSKHEWLVMAEEEAFTVLAENGYVFERVTRLEGLGLQLAEVSAPASFDISEVRAGIMDVVGSDLAEVDINHLYTAGVPTPSVASGLSPQAAMPFPADTAGMSLRIGMIDTAVDESHSAFSGSTIHSRHFVNDADKTPSFHGTAIASLLSARSSEYSGIAPESTLFAASVFEEHDQKGEVASTASLVKALDWLTREEVEVVNISLAGPPNRLLEAVLNRVSQRGIPVLAAAGNGGPASEPLYPAAYDSVVAITAVESSGRVFRLANRGNHLDLSAPGVNIRHAEAGGGYRVSSGTSFAVPFASVAVARLRNQHPDGDALAELYRSALDLGPPGKDSIYGYGLLNPEAPQQIAAR